MLEILEIFAVFIGCSMDLDITNILTQRQWRAIIRRLQLLFLYGRIIYLFFKIFRMGTLEPVTIPDTDQTLPLLMKMIMTKCFKEQRKTVFNTKQCHYQKLHIISEQNLIMGYTS